MCVYRRYFRFSLVHIHYRLLLSRGRAIYAMRAIKRVDVYCETLYRTERKKRELKSL